MRGLATIGAYGFTADTFPAALTGAGVTVLVDVRQRRGVRGAQYAWANAARLQAALEEAGIGYRHWPQVAPTSELRALQYEGDAVKGEGKRSRTHLSKAFRDAYTTQILDPVDLRPLVAELPVDTVAALFCVERDAPACHRSLVAARLEAELGIVAVHLTPG